MIYKSATPSKMERKAISIAHHIMNISNFFGCFSLIHLEPVPGVYIFQNNPLSGGLFRGGGGKMIFYKWGGELKNIIQTEP